MSTQEIANRLVELCRKGEYDTCYAELFSPEIQSVEADGATVQGFDALKKKGEEWNASMEEFMGSEIGDPIVSGNFFSLPMSFTAKFKGAPSPTKMEEICVYQVKDGKIVKEQFFYDR